MIVVRQMDEKESVGMMVPEPCVGRRWTQGASLQRPKQMRWRMPRRIAT